MASSIVAQAVGERVFVVGDLHACPAEPELLFNFLLESEGFSESDLLIFLGDYIDRGLDSKAVVELMVNIKRQFPRTRFLKGNHEDMLLDFLGFGGNLGQAFLYNGGVETIQSYGISVFAPPGEMIAALPPSHFKFYCELESVITVGNYVCVHAGLNPLRDLYAQNDSDVLWIREEFLNNIHSFQRTVVFGHTPHREIFEHLPFKLGIDTGLVFGNKLSCVELKSGVVFQIARESKEIEVSQMELPQFLD